jgi:hypothetical protein
VTEYGVDHVAGCILIPVVAITSPCLSARLSETIVAVVTAGVLTGEGACVAGVSDLFLRRPAACGGSSGCSGGGDPDIGGEGRQAQQGVGIGLDKLRFSENREGSLSNLCLLNEGGIGGTPGSRKECMRVTDNWEATQGNDKIWCTWVMSVSSKCRSTRRFV